MFRGIVIEIGFVNAGYGSMRPPVRLKMVPAISCENFSIDLGHGPAEHGNQQGVFRRNAHSHTTCERIAQAKLDRAQDYASGVPRGWPERR